MVPAGSAGSFDRSRFRGGTCRHWALLSHEAEGVLLGFSGGVGVGAGLEVFRIPST